MTAAMIRKAGEGLASAHKSQHLPAKVVDEVARILEAVAERLKREGAVTRKAAS